MNQRHHRLHEPKTGVRTNSASLPPSWATIGCSCGYESKSAKALPDRGQQNFTKHWVGKNPWVVSEERVEVVNVVHKSLINHHLPSTRDVAKAELGKLT